MSVIFSLLFIVTVLGSLALFTTALVALIRRRRETARRFALSASFAIVGYALILLIASVASHERVLGRGEPLKFCAADCDLQFAVDNVEKQPGKLVVTVRVQSKAARVTMMPDAPEALLIDQSGREYLPTDELDPLPFARRVGPGDSYQKTLVFHVPADMREPRLILSEGGWVTKLIAGDENSFFHKKTLIRLD